MNRKTRLFNILRVQPTVCAWFSNKCLLSIALAAGFSSAAVCAAYSEANNPQEGTGTPGLLDLSRWHYMELDSARAQWGNFADPSWLRYFGLDTGDVNSDRLTDILAGRYVYLNPGPGLIGVWERRDLGINADGILLVDVDSDDFADIIAQALPELYWIEALDSEARIWEARPIGSVPATEHVNSQGFALAQLVPGEKPEILVAGKGGIYAFQIPDNPLKADWARRLIAEDASDKGIGVGDVDGDGLLDIAAGSMAQDESQVLMWWKNPGTRAGNWAAFRAGETTHPIDRVAVGDLNQDGLADIVVSEERYPGPDPDAHLFIFEQEASVRLRWSRRSLLQAYSLNNLDLADLDRDGDLDIVIAEHKGPEPRLWILENLGRAVFTANEIDRGKESHLGAQTADLDGDGDKEIISIGWDRPALLHLWRNDAISLDTYADFSRWDHVSSTNGDLPSPNSGNQQTSSVVADIDGDGVHDFLIAERTRAPAIVLYRRRSAGWTVHIVEASALRVEAGAAVTDIDADGDLDLVFGGDAGSPGVWWWENPGPNLSASSAWRRRAIKSSGAHKHHDQLFGDFDADGRQELAFWNQGANTLFVAEIPADPKSAGEWPRIPVYTYSSDGEMRQRGRYPAWKGIHEHEGLAKADIDGDGLVDLVGGGRWFKYLGPGQFQVHEIDAGYTFTRAAAGQVIPGGRPEVLLVAGDGTAPLVLYEWQNGRWEPRILLKEVHDGHSLDLIDFNGDGHLDVFTAEMRLGSNPGAKTRILLGDGKGNFRIQEVASGYGLHEARIADLDGDGDLDILAKPYTWEAPRLDVWLQRPNR